MDRTEEPAGVGDRALPSRPSAGESALLCAPAMDHRADEGCMHLSGLHGAGAFNYLGVTLSGTVDEEIDRWRGHAGERPAKLAVVTAGDETRGAAAAGGGTGTVSAGGVSATSVSSPDDLTGLGIKVSECLSSWADDDADAVVCFRSLTTLLQYGSLQRVFRFLHLLTRRIESFGVHAHFHIDPDAHDRREMATLRNLFDRVYQLNPDGQWFEA